MPLPSPLTLPPPFCPPLTPLPSFLFHSCLSPLLLPLLTLPSFLLLSSPFSLPSQDPTALVHSQTFTPQLWGGGPSWASPSVCLSIPSWAPMPSGAWRQGPRSGAQGEAAQSCNNCPRGTRSSFCHVPRGTRASMAHATLRNYKVKFGCGMPRERGEFWGGFSVLYFL